MRDFLFTAKRQKTEIIWFIACFCGTVLINVVSIIFYQTSWKELYTQILWVAIITCALYAVSVGVRVGLYLIKSFLARR